jgi:hypothetical protein
VNVLYLVVGKTGEYEDRVLWYVAAYTDKSKAEIHARNAMARARELDHWACPHCGEGWSHHDPEWGISDCAYPINEYDPDMSLSYTGADYEVAEVLLLDEVPLGVSLEGSP